MRALHQISVGLHVLAYHEESAGRADLHQAVEDFGGVGARRAVVKRQRDGLIIGKIVRLDLRLFGHVLSDVGVEQRRLNQRVMLRIERVRREVNDQRHAVQREVEIPQSLVRQHLRNSIRVRRFIREIVVDLGFELLAQHRPALAAFGENIRQQDSFAGRHVERAAGELLRNQVAVVGRARLHEEAHPRQPRFAMADFNIQPAILIAVRFPCLERRGDFVRIRLRQPIDFVIDARQCGFDRPQPDAALVTLLGIGILRRHAVARLHSALRRCGCGQHGQQKDSCKQAGNVLLHHRNAPFQCARMLRLLCRR